MYYSLADLWDSYIMPIWQAAPFKILVLLNIVFLVPGVLLKARQAFTKANAGFATSYFIYRAYYLLLAFNFWAIGQATLFMSMNKDLWQHRLNTATDELVGLAIFYFIVPWLGFLLWQSIVKTCRIHRKA